MRLALVLLTTLLLTTAALAQPNSGELEQPLYILVTDNDGIWDVEQQKRFRPPASLGTEASVSTDWKALLKTRPFRFLSYGDRVALMRHPERLLASSWANQLFAARHVMVMRPAGKSRIEGRLFDFVTGEERPVVVPLSRGKQDQKRSEALEEALNHAEVAKESVVAHPESGLYHRPESPHLSPRVQYETAETAQRAELHGFRPCRVCYPESNRDFLYDDLDKRLGQVVAQTIESRYRLAPEGPDTERVRVIGQRLLRENRFLDQGYRFLLLDTDTINAFAAPTGPIYITTGMLDILESDDELAGILGHELSHSERRHARRQYEQSQSAGILGVLVTVATGIPWARLGSDILATVLVRGYSRGYELEADRDGMMTAYAAGYVPEDFLLVQAKLQELSEQRGGGGPDWLRTHPRGEERTRQLNEILDRTETLRERLSTLESWDPGMASFLKGRALFLSDDTTELTEYLAKYNELAKRIDTSALDEPLEKQPLPPTDEELEEIWEMLDAAFDEPAEEPPTERELEEIWEMLESILDDTEPIP